MQAFDCLRCLRLGCWERSARTRSFSETGTKSAAGCTANSSISFSERVRSPRSSSWRNRSAADDSVPTVERSLRRYARHFPRCARRFSPLAPGLRPSNLASARTECRFSRSSSPSSPSARCSSAARTSPSTPFVPRAYCSLPRSVRRDRPRCRHAAPRRSGSAPARSRFGATFFPGHLPSRHNLARERARGYRHFVHSFF